MVLADSWYVSGTFWTAAGAVAVLITGGIATYVAFILASPVRHLECSMSATKLLRGSAQDMPGNLQITWDGAELRDPVILEIRLVSRGRQDIVKDDFEQALEFRVNAKILAILKSDSHPNSSAFPAVAFDDDLLKVGPGLIRRRQSINFTLLASGADPVLSSSAAAVRDVDVDVIATGQPSSRWPVQVKLAAALAVAAVMAGLVLIGLLIGHESSPPVRTLTASHPPTPITSPTAGLAPRPTTSPTSEALPAAEAELLSASRAAQSAGIRALQQIMKGTPADQPAVLADLTGFIRRDSPTGSNDQPVTTIIQAALSVLVNRNPAYDSGTVINLSEANLTSADLSGINLVGAQLVNTDFDTANLGGANLRGADLNYAFVGGANLSGANLDGANLADASFYQTTMCHGATPTQPKSGYSCSAN